MVISKPITVCSSRLREGAFMVLNIILKTVASKGYLTAAHTKKAVTLLEILGRNSIEYNPQIC